MLNYVTTISIAFMADDQASADLMAAELITTWNDQVVPETPSELVSTVQQ